MKLLKNFLIFVLTLVTFSCSCATIRTDDEVIVGQIMRQTVRILRFEENELASGYTATGSGTGVIVAEYDDGGKDKLSIVLTAAHVITGNNPEEGQFVITTLNGDSCIAAPIHIDVKLDLGTLLVGCNVGEVANLSAIDPVTGSQVMIPGAPQAIRFNGSFLLSEGRVLGAETKRDTLILTAPIVGGYSGAGVFYRGRLVGVVLEMGVSYEYLSYAAGKKSIQEVVLKTIEKLKKK